MGRPRKEGYETLGIRLHGDVISHLKIEAVRRKIPVSELVLEACMKAGLIETKEPIPQKERVLVSKRGGVSLKKRGVRS